MRLLDVTTFELREVFGKAIPAYAILSHRWEEEEVSFDDLNKGAREKKGWRKIEHLCSLAAARGLCYAWIDTCCIDKANSTELSEAINSMFRWYRQSQVCFVYMSDVDVDELPWHSSFNDSEWFLRGWTLQELLAPRKVEFFDKNWSEIGSKDSLTLEIQNATGIFKCELLDFTKTSIARRMSWASKRKTTREEDAAYCLMGLFDVNMPLLYGEGQKAFLRLQYQMLQQSDDDSIFAWEADGARSGLLASSPVAFSKSGWVHRGSRNTRQPCFLTNRGICIELPLMPVWPEGKYGVKYWRARLNCYREIYSDMDHIFIHLVPKTRNKAESQFCRIGPIVDSTEISAYRESSGLSERVLDLPADILDSENPSPFTWKKLYVSQEDEHDWRIGYTGLCESYIPTQRRPNVMEEDPLEGDYGHQHWHIDLEQVERERLVMGLKLHTQEHNDAAQQGYVNEFDYTLPDVIDASFVSRWLQRLSLSDTPAVTDPCPALDETRQLLQQLQNVHGKKGYDAADNYSSAFTLRDITLKTLESIIFQQRNKRYLQSLPPHKAARSGDMTFLGELIDDKNVNLRNCEEQTPLHIALINGQATFASLLIDLDADIAVKNAKGFAPLHLATFLNDEFLVAKLVRQEGVDMNARQGFGTNNFYWDHLGVTPLHIAALKDSVSMTSMLLENGADPTVSTDDDHPSETPLCFAIRAHNLRVTRVLLAWEVKTDQRSSYLGSALIEAVDCVGSSEIVKLLVEMGAPGDVKKLSSY